MIYQSVTYPILTIFMPLIQTTILPTCYLLIIETALSDIETDLLEIETAMQQTEAALPKIEIHILTQS